MANWYQPSLMRFQTFSIIVSCLVLASCGKPQQIQSTLTSDEVLSRAVRAVQTLDSADYRAEGNFTLRNEGYSVDGTAHIDGTLADAGAQVRFVVDTDAEVVLPTSEFSFSGSMEVVVMTEDDIYLNVHSLSTKPDTALFKPEMLQAVTEKWWILTGSEPTPLESISPDPRLLQAQAEVVSVTKDKGIETVNGRLAYSYDVELDSEKLLSYLKSHSNSEGDGPKDIGSIQGSGQLWIDAETYYVQKIIWNIKTDTSSAAFTVNFTNHNSAAAITPPSNAVEFSPAAFFIPSVEDIPALHSL